MSLTKTAIKNNRVTLLLLIILIVGGITGYHKLTRSYDPGFVIRNAQVVTLFPGASPRRVEQLVTDKIEKKIQEIPELEYVKSHSKTGVSIIFLKILHQYKNMRPIWDKVRRKVNDAVVELPEGIVGPFVNDDFGDVFGIVAGITGEEFSYAELKTIADQFKNELLVIDNVGKVEIYGAQEKRIFIEYSDSKLAELKISPFQLMNILKSRNIIIPGGELLTGRERIMVEPSGNFLSIDEMRKTLIKLPNREDLLSLGDLVKIKSAYIDPPDSKLTVSGKKALCVAVSMRTGGNLIALGEQVKSLISRLELQSPYGIEFEIVNFEPLDVNNKFYEFRNNLLQAILVVTLVMILTLGIRTGLIVMTLIPVTILTSIFIMFTLHIGFNQVTLSALIISLGMLVDNAIVMGESMTVLIYEGSDPVDAAIRSEKELSFPLLISSLTTAAAFLPVFLANSESGEYTAPIFNVVTITLLSSWVLSLTMIPLIYIQSTRLGEIKKSSIYFQNSNIYKKILCLSLKYRYQSLSIIILIFMGALYSAQFLPVIFFPPSDRTYFRTEIFLPRGTAIEITEKAVKKIDKFIEKEMKITKKKENGVINWISYIGEGGPRFVLPHEPEISNPEYALFVINVTSVIVIEEMMEKIHDYIFNNIPEAKIRLKRIENGPPIKYPVEIRISGRDQIKIFAIVKLVKEQLGNLKGTYNIIDNWERRIKKIVVKVNQLRARRANITNQDIAVSLKTNLTGLKLTEFRKGDELIPIVFRSVLSDKSRLRNIENINIYAQRTGMSVPLKQVADIKIEWESADIIRRNRQMTVTVSCELEKGITPAYIEQKILPWLEKEKKNWDIGYRYEFGGEIETSGKANSSIAEKLPIGGFLIILLLFIQFNSFRKSLIVLVTIPLGLIGVIAGLFITDLYFGFMTLLGIVSLSGIVVNNAIVLLERIKYEILNSGLSLQKAIIEAAQRRLRPILLTTATTVGGMLPLYFGGGEMWKPMAAAIIFGLIFSTILTLFVVPVIYSIMYRPSHK